MTGERVASFLRSACVGVFAGLVCVWATSGLAQVVGGQPGPVVGDVAVADMMLYSACLDQFLLDEARHKDAACAASVGSGITGPPVQVSYAEFPFVGVLFRGGARKCG